MFKFIKKKKIFIFKKEKVEIRFKMNIEKNDSFEKLSSELDQEVINKD